MVNKEYAHILLDLDDTIIDSGVGVTKSVQYALACCGIKETDRARLDRFVGPPLKDSFMDFYGLTEEQAEVAIEKYRERYVAKGINENRVYNGIPEALKAWHEAGKKLYLCTSKPEIFAEKILEDLGLTRYFDFIGGASLDGVRNRKEEVMTYVLNRAGITDRRSCVMIGDRKFDILAAGEMGIDSVGVLYGYGCREEFETAGATFIVETAAELMERI